MKRKAFTLVEMMVVLAIIGLFAAMLMPAIQKAHQHYLAKQHANQPPSAEELQPIPYKGGVVYYFPYTGEKFRQALALFISSHTNLEVTAGWDDVEKKGFSDGAYGETTGHTLVVREKTLTAER